LFQADLFNAFNRANFLAVNVNASNPEFGSVTSAAPGRNIQFGIKLSFYMDGTPRCRVGLE